jgi:hypothetical protein
MPKETTMPTVELLFFPDCPNVPAAREQLCRAMKQAGLPPSWGEYDVTDPTVPEHMRRFGSPTILVEGNDVTGSAPPTEGSSCRVYVGSDVRGVPPLESIVQALSASRSQPSSNGGGQSAIAGGLAMAPESAPMAPRDTCGCATKKARA